MPRLEQGSMSAPGIEQSRLLIGGYEPMSIIMGQLTLDCNGELPLNLALKNPPGTGGLTLVWNYNSC